MLLRLARYLLLLVLASAAVAGVWTLWHALFKPSPTAEFQGRLRLPQYVPESFKLDSDGFPDEAEVRAGLQRPSLVIKWEPSGGPLWRSAAPGVMLLQVDDEFDLYMGGEREPVEVDGVEGWLYHLGPEDFTSPEGRERFALWKEWPESALRYSSIMGQRGIPPPEDNERFVAIERKFAALGPELAEGDPEAVEEALPVLLELTQLWTPTLLWGEAIALQWNREGIHYLLIAQDIEPMTLDELFKMANSLAPAEYPFPDFGKRPGSD